MNPDDAADLVQQIIRALRDHIDELHADAQRAVAENQRTAADLARRLAAIELQHAPGAPPRGMYMRTSELRATPP